MPLEPTSDDVKSVVLEFIDRSARRGRPVTLTIRRFLKICHNIEAGFSVPKACEAESVSYRNFRFRVSSNPRLQKRLKESEAVRLALRHEQALESIMAAGDRSWMAHAWFLERVWPSLYSLRPISRDSDEGQPTEEEIPAEVLARHRALLLELAREDEARQASNRVPELPGPQAA
jgi:hypothetical protein